MASATTVPMSASVIQKCFDIQIFLLRSAAVPAAFFVAGRAARDRGYGAADGPKSERVKTHAAVWLQFLQPTGKKLIDSFLH